MAGFRTFVSVEVAPVVELASALADLARADPSLKVVSADALHLTLAFLGEVAPAQVDLAREACEEAAREARSFRMTFRGLGAFGERRATFRPRVIWVGVADGERELLALAAAVREGLAARRVPFDAKPFRAHVTLARLREGRAASPALATHLAAYESTPLGSREVTELRLLKSDLTPSGPVYTLVAAAPLAKVAPAGA